MTTKEETLKIKLYGDYTGYKVIDDDNDGRFKADITRSQAQRIRNLIKYLSMRECVITVKIEVLFTCALVNIEIENPTNTEVYTGQFLQNYTVGKRGKIKQLS